MSVVEGSSHVTTVASKVTILATSAINELLLGEREEIATLDGPGSFEGANG
jgi:hypothetical protein